MLQRIYGTAFPSQDELDQHLARLKKPRNATTAPWAASWTSSQFR